MPGRSSARAAAFLDPCDPLMGMWHMRAIGVRELKQSLGATLRAFGRAEQIRGRPIADIVPAGAGPGNDVLRELVAGGRLVPPSTARPVRPPALLNSDGSASDLVLVEREAER
jgi:antitoxin (DNA-binding transcriptional repressor) of toxin-antitoxin stability system